MNIIEVYNFLDGKNLCNIFSSLLVNSIKDNNPNAITEITVINVRNFFIVKGTTTSDVVINPSEILQNFLKDYDEDKSNSVRVIDIISYNTNINKKLNINLTFDKIVQNNLLKSEEFINSFLNEKIYFNYKINSLLKKINYDCESFYIDSVKKIISNNFDGFDIVKDDFSQEIYISDRFYGLGNHPEISYTLLLKNITNHLFTLGISKRLSFSLYSDLNFEEIDEENCFFKINNDDHIVNTEWLESLILDIFPFKLNELNLYLGVDDYNALDDIISNDKSPVWFNLKNSKNILLI